MYEETTTPREACATWTGVREVPVSRKPSEVPTGEETECGRRSGSLLVSKPGSQWDSGRNRRSKPEKKSRSKSKTSRENDVVRKVHVLTALTEVKAIIQSAN